MLYQCNSYYKSFYSHPILEYLIPNDLKRPCLATSTGLLNEKAQLPTPHPVIHMQTMYLP